MILRLSCTFSLLKIITYINCDLVLGLHVTFGDMPYALCTGIKLTASIDMNLQPFHTLGFLKAKVAISDAV
jgi:hypothetical protein